MRNPRIAFGLLSRNSPMKHLKRNLFQSIVRYNSLILGIETSCDDTGSAVVNEEGKVIGEALHSQQKVHLRLGGIIPPLARDMHLAHIEKVVTDSLKNANLTLNDVDAIATTVKPGLPLSLKVGLDYAKELCAKAKKPFIPIHHMEAHALTVRMVQKVQFPFLVFLLSGGHCILSIVKDVETYLRLGDSIDDAPGEAFDKTARRLKLQNIERFEELSGGQAIEILAKSGDPKAFDFPMVLAKYRHCMFSFSGIKFTALKHILREEEFYNIEGGMIIPSLNDLCASFQHSVAKHLCQRLQRAMEYIALKELLPQDRLTLVVSGGVACNSYIKSALEQVCNHYGYTMCAPPPKLCTDNGIMIAWNGMEKWKVKSGIVDDPTHLDIQAKCELGEDLTEDVLNEQIKCNWLKINDSWSQEDIQLNK